MIMILLVFGNFRASDWKLDQPDWTGRMRVVAKGKDLSIKLEDKTSGTPNISFLSTFNYSQNYVQTKYDVSMSICRFVSLESDTNRGINISGGSRI